jgi:hypothetical protein
VNIEISACVASVTASLTAVIMLSMRIRLFKWLVKRHDISNADDCLRDVWRAPNPDQQIVGASALDIPDAPEVPLPHDEGASRWLGVLWQARELRSRE